MSNNVRKLLMLARRAGIEVNFADYEIDSNGNLTKRADVAQARGEIKAESKIIPPLPIIGSGKGSLGFSQEIAPGQRNTLINVSGEDIHGSVMTVVLSGRPQNTGTAFIPPGFAYIRWGIGGFQAEAEIDIGRGQAITLVASSVRVDVVNDSDVAASGVWGAFIGCLPISKSTKLVRSLRTNIPFIQTLEGAGPVLSLNGLAGGGAITIRIPNFSKDVTVYREPMNAIEVQFNDETQNRYQEDYGVGQASNNILIANDIRTIRVVNNGAGAIDLRPVFGLGI